MKERDKKVHGDFCYLLKAKGWASREHVDAIPGNSRQIEYLLSFLPLNYEDGKERGVYILLEFIPKRHPYEL